MRLRNDRLDGTIEQDWRSPAERDEDRLLYTSAFRRLTGVTQVVPSRETNLFHNRLTHSLKVGQVGNRTARYLILRTDPAYLRAGGGLDPTVLSAAGQAHDLGHPPFGHIAETELRRILDGNHKAITAEHIRPGMPRASGFLLRDSFEGNAQTFRIVTKLAQRKERGPPWQHFSSIHGYAESIPRTENITSVSGEPMTRNGKNSAGPAK